MDTEQTKTEVIEVITPAIEKIQLTLNSEVLKEIKKERVTVSQLFVLFGLYHKAINLLDIYDDKTTDDQVLVFDYQVLLIHGFITDQAKGTLFEITDSGKDFVEKVYSMMEATQDSENELNIRKLCQDYLELWPKIKLPSQKYARVSILEIEKKMKTWLKTNKALFKKEYGIKISDSDILEATKAYIERYARNGYKFMVTSSYFIQKNEKSALADELIARKQGLDTSNQSKDNITVM